MTGMTRDQLSETIERLRADVRKMENGSSTVLKTVAQDIKAHIEELERERAMIDPLPHWF